MKEFLKSKKAIGMLVGLLVLIIVNLVLAPLGFDLTPEQMADLNWAIGILVASYVASQGLADAGKEKAKEERKPGGRAEWDPR